MARSQKDCFAMQTKRVQTPREVARHLRCNACNTNATICNSLQKYKISAAIRSLEPANWPGSQGLPCGVQKADAMHLRMQQATPSCGFGKQAPPVMRMRVRMQPMPSRACNDQQLATKLCKMMQCARLHNCNTSTNNFHDNSVICKQQRSKRSTSNGKRFLPQKLSN
jgi:hypothetical protein